MNFNNYSKYMNKLMDIQQALTLVDMDRELIVTICNEMAFQWVALILEDLNLLIEENHQLSEESTKLHMQNDSLLLQNINLSQRLHDQ